MLMAYPAALSLFVFLGVCQQDFGFPELCLLCLASRWIYLNDQNLCIPASSSFVYGAVPIGASIYVIGDLDTGE